MLMDGKQFLDGQPSLTKPDNRYPATDSSVCTFAHTFPPPSTLPDSLILDLEACIRLVEFWSRG